MYVIGTAGHVDHGKSTLVQALTGIDPDRLREEKERGLTIDLGFAWLKLPDGREVSIVDVPGHERFVRNMLAGAGGVDLALLVVAADEGVMPQTREHLAILDLLGVSHGVVALTKRDLVDDELAELVALDVRETLAGTALADAPLVACSATTGEGLTQLVDVLSAALDTTPRKRDLGRPRLPIDRAFTISGFGTVVTGTLIDGELAVGDMVELHPGGARARIRGLQMHRAKADRASPGNRVAVNLSGLAPTDIERGMVLASPGWLRPTNAIGVRLRAVPDLPRPLRHNARVTFHSGCAECPGTVRLLEDDELLPGDEAWAQVRLDREVALVRGDRFVLRVAGETVGGGAIVEVHAPRRRRRHQPTLAALEAHATGPREAVLGIAQSRPFITLAQLASQVELAVDDVVATVRSAIDAGLAVALPLDHPVGPGSMVVATETVDALAGRASQVLADFHASQPLRSGMPREELRSRLRLDARPFAAILPLFEARGVVRTEGANIGLASFEPRLTAEQDERVRGFLQRLREQPFASPPGDVAEAELLAYLEARGDIVLVDGIAFDAGVHRRIVDEIIEMIHVSGRVSLAEVRDHFKTSRRYAQTILQDLDRRRITRRVGDERVLASEGAAAQVRA
ncbi:MAG TPA: selenocysteine-specific translation elongation factor [Dehalococcoidia bacterium]|nr:selenocysteine-specific translation elongation factor [Dehalococcoidia bacterium]